MKLKKRLALMVTLMAVFSLLSYNSVLAAGNVGITVANPDPYSTNKSWFYFTYEKGKTLNSSVLVKNFGKDETVVNVYPVDATVNEAGSFVLRFQNENQKGLGQWIKINLNTVKLAPGESKEVPFSLDLPEGVEPGEYFGGIVVQEANDLIQNNEQNSKNSIGASVQTRVGSRVYLNVPGDVHEDFQWSVFANSADEFGDKSYFKFSLENNGNVSFVPRVTLHFYNWFGREVLSTSHDLGVSLPGSVIEPMVQWEEKPFFGKYTVKAELAYKRSSEGQTTQAKEKILNKQVMIWVVPWKELAFLAMLLCVVVISLWYRGRRWMKIKQSAEKYVVKASDNIQDLARGAGISWRMLAKLNNLQPPYVLEKGQTILIPKNKN